MNKAKLSTLQLPPEVLSNLDSLGYTCMTAIQAESLPAILDGRDVIAQAKTGSGKTAAFGLGLLTNINPRWFAIQALEPQKKIEECVALAKESLESGKALATLRKFLTLNQ